MIDLRLERATFLLIEFSLAPFLCNTSHLGLLLLLQIFRKLFAILCSVLRLLFFKLFLSGEVDLWLERADFLLSPLLLLLKLLFTLDSFVIIGSLDDRGLRSYPG